MKGVGRMELSRLIAALAAPAAYPIPSGPSRWRSDRLTSLLCLLAGPFAYKVKKPLDLGFLDYGTLERRRHFCEQEVLLDRRLAPPVYLGVVPVTADESGIHVEGPGEIAADRDPGTQPGALRERGSRQGGPRGAGRGRPGRDRVRRPACPWCRGGAEGGASQLPQGRGRHLERPGWQALLDPRLTKLRSWWRRRRQSTPSAWARRWT